MFGHKWKYSINGYGSSPQQELRACKRCGIIEEYRRNFPAYGTNWFQLVMRTDKGAKDNLAKLEKEDE